MDGETKHICTAMSVQNPLKYSNFQRLPYIDYMIPQNLALVEDQMERLLLQKFEHIIIKFTAMYWYEKGGAAPFHLLDSS
jgi:hypothetical protein